MTAVKKASEELVGRKPRKKSSSLSVVLAGIIAALGVSVISDETVYLVRQRTATEAALQPVLSATVNNHCAKSDLLGVKVSYSAPAPIGIFPLIFGKLLEARTAGTLVTRSVVIEKSTKISMDSPNAVREALTIVADELGTHNQYRVTNPSPSTKCLAALKTAAGYDAVLRHRL